MDRWEVITGPDVTETSLINVNVLSVDEGKNVYRTIDTNKRRKIRHG